MYTTFDFYILKMSNFWRPWEEKVNTKKSEGKIELTEQVQQLILNVYSYMCAKKGLQVL